MTENDSGLVPVEYRCVLKLDPVEQKTAGGIILPNERTEKDQMAATRGTLVAIGGNAFTDWEGRTPEVGDKVLIQKYAGQFRAADPEDLYRVVQDKEILAVIEE